MGSSLPLRPATAGSCVLILCACEATAGALRDTVARGVQQRALRRGLPYAGPSAPRERCFKPLPLLLLPWRGDATEPLAWSDSSAVPTHLPSSLEGTAQREPGGEAAAKAPARPGAALLPLARGLEGGGSWRRPSIRSPHTRRSRPAEPLEAELPPRIERARHGGATTCRCFDERKRREPRGRAPRSRCVRSAGGTDATCRPTRS